MKTKNIKVVVLSIAGSAGKSTFSKHCLSPLIPNSTRIAVEDWNTGDGKADLEINAKGFYGLAVQVNVDDDQSFIIDVGTSNSKSMMKHFADLQLTREKIDFWIVPVRAGSKERIDTLKTISLLLELSINPKSIIVIGQAVADIHQFKQEFGPLMEAAQEHGFIFAEQGVLFNDVFDMIKGGHESIFDIVREKPDFNAMRSENRGNVQKLMEIGSQMLIYSLAQTATQNLSAVFLSTPLAAALSLEAELSS